MASILSLVTLIPLSFLYDNVKSVFLIRLSTLTSVANDLLNDALRLDNELSALAATRSLQSVSKVHY